MSSIPENITHPRSGHLAVEMTTDLAGAPSAANSTHLSDQLARNRQTHAPLTETASGWDAYDVWRRFIKEARERRRTG